MTLVADVRRRIGSLQLDASFSIDKGETIAVVGPNGAGKTSLVRTIAGLAAVDEGRIAWDEFVWDESGSGVFVSPERRPIGYVFQDHALFEHLSVF